jgi:hypothetical protein
MGLRHIDQILIKKLLKEYSQHDVYWNKLSMIQLHQKYPLKGLFICYELHKGESLTRFYTRVIKALYREEAWVQNSKYLQEHPHIASQTSPPTGGIGPAYFWQCDPRDGFILEGEKSKNSEFVWRHLWSLYFKS